MKKAFTLAEVLITLAIIGVVAALTIPAVITNYNKNQFYTRFIRIYNTLTTAFQLSVAQNGDPANWDLRNAGDDGIGDEEAFKKYWGNYLKVATYCSNNAKACGAEGKKTYSFSGEDYGDYSIVVDDSRVSLILQDGTYIGVMELVGDFWIDTNGPSKGPNTLGRDNFQFIVSDCTPNKNYMVYPIELYINEGSGCTPNDLENNIIVNCEESGSGCGARLLLEGKMNY